MLNESLYAVRILEAASIPKSKGKMMKKAVPWWTDNIIERNGTIQF